MEIIEIHVCEEENVIRDNRNLETQSYKVILAMRSKTKHDFDKSVYLFSLIHPDDG